MSRKSHCIGGHTKELMYQAQEQKNPLDTDLGSDALMSCVARKPASGFLTRLNTYQTVESQKRARCLKLYIYTSRGGNELSVY